MEPLWVAVLTSGAVFSFIQFLITMAFSRKDKTKEIDEKIDSLSERMDANAAILARTHILRFADDLRNHGIDYHSEEYYRQQLQDCDTYDRYCESHPGFSNGLTQIANEYIKHSFEELYTKGVKHEQ